MQAVFVRMIASILSVLALFCFLLAAQGGQAKADEGVLTLAPRSYVEVTGEQIRLSDVLPGAPQQAASVVLARAPAPGQSLVIPVSEIAQAAQRLGLTLAEGFTRVVQVHRSGRRILRADLEDRLADLLARRLGEERLSVILSGMRPITLPAGAKNVDVQLAITAIDRRTHRFVARLRWPDGFGHSQTTELAGRYEPLVAVPVLAHVVARGDIVSQADLKTVWLPARRLARGLLVSADDIIGHEATRSLRPGVPLRRGDLRRPLLVKKGEPVTVRVAAGAMILTAQGRAMQDGARGDVVRVLNGKSRRIVEGRVVRAGLVEVAWRPMRITPGGPAVMR